MRLISGILNILQAVFVWSTLAGAVVLLVGAVSSLVKRAGNWKQWLIAAVCAIYIIAFVIFMVFYNDVFETIASILFWLVAIIATQKSKYEDRKAGNRWWTK